ncbi:MAG: amidohydrolase [Lewinellaceae bacterium]|nr:amidohydrolase [Lewinellaceae bacterium]
MNSTLKEQIKAQIRECKAEVIAIRRHLHMHPELSFQEEETGRFIAAQLAAWGIPHEHGIAENGVLALIVGEQAESDQVIALRADIDALPIQETNEVPYRSQRQGLMHACGHDVHTASLLGAARVLWQLRTQFSGTIKLLFQPAEEMLPGGASVMIREGALENPRPAGIFGQHVYPVLEAGKVGFRGGRYMASCDELYVTVTGKGGHGATPHLTVDPILIAAHLVVALQQVVSRNADPTIPSVLTFGKITSTGGSTNIIPQEVKLMGTFRTLDENWRSEAHQRMQRIAEHLVQGMGGHCDFRIEVGYPYLSNDEALTARARRYAEDFLGKDAVVDLPIRLTAEDFSYYSQVLPACFYRLGTGNIARGITANVHTSTFDIDEEALEIGAGLMAWLAICELAEK